MEGLQGTGAELELSAQRSSQLCFGSIGEETGFFRGVLQRGRGGLCLLFFLPVQMCILQVGQLKQNYPRPFGSVRISRTALNSNSRWVRTRLSTLPGPGNAGFPGPYPGHWLPLEQYHWTSARTFSEF